MTALSGRMSFLATIIIILHLNIDSCSGNTRKHNLVEAKAKNASLVKHADGNIPPRHTGTMANKLHCLRWGKIKKSESGQDYQQSMDTDGASPAPAADRSMDATIYYCRRTVNKPLQNFTVSGAGHLNKQHLYQYTRLVRPFSLESYLI